ncbi:MAG: aminomethyltransferase beta-barrel domain-containing protein, partial [Hyphomicrobiaceae bacterium]
IRSSQPARPGRLMVEGGEPVVELLAGDYGISPGQACVLYSPDEIPARVLGGGIIEAAGPRTIAAPAHADSSEGAIR